MKQEVEIFGGNGQHGSDLIQNRGIFDGINIKKIGKKQNTTSQVAKAVIIPISQTTELITSIVNNGQDEDIINGSGIMSTTPEPIRGNNGVENFHFLFGPKATSNLKYILAFEKTLSPLGNKIIANCRGNSIQMIESSIKQHDKNMAFIQGLNHLVRQLLLHSNVQTTLPKINTTLQTVQDMVLLNPHMDGIMQGFNSILCSDEFNLCNFFNNLIEENLTEKDIQDFSTPAFMDTLNFMRTNTVILKSNEILKYLKILKV